MALMRSLNKQHSMDSGEKTDRTSLTTPVSLCVPEKLFSKGCTLDDRSHYSPIIKANYGKLHAQACP